MQPRLSNAGSKVNLLSPSVKSKKGGLSIEKLNVKSAGKATFVKQNTRGSTVALPDIMNRSFQNDHGSANKG
jgi:hypothetical protein